MHFFGSTICFEPLHVLTMLHVQGEFFNVASTYDAASTNDVASTYDAASTYHWCLFCQYLYGIYSAKVISTEKWCLEGRHHKV